MNDANLKKSFEKSNALIPCHPSRIRSRFLETITTGLVQDREIYYHRHPGLFSLGKPLVLDCVWDPVCIKPDASFLVSIQNGRMDEELWNVETPLKILDFGFWILDFGFWILEFRF